MQNQIEPYQRIINNFQNFQNIQKNLSYSYENGLKLLQALGRLEKKEIQKNRQNLQSPIHKSNKKTSPEKITNLNFTLKKLPLQQQISLQNTEQDKFSYSEILPNIEDQTAENVAKMFKIATLNYKLHSSQEVTLLESDKRLLECIQQNKKLFLSTVDNWLFEEYITNKQERYFIIFDEILDIVSQFQIVEIQEISLYQQFLTKIPIINEKFFDFLYQLYKQNNEILSQQDEKQVNLVQIFINWIYNVPQLQLKQYGLKLFLKLNRNEVVQNIYNFYKYDEYQAIIQENLKIRFETLKQEPSIKLDIESEDINIIASQSICFYMSNFCSNIIQQLILQFNDLKEEVQTKFLERVYDIFDYYYQDSQSWQIMAELLKQSLNIQNLKINEKIIEYLKDKQDLQFDLLQSIADYFKNFKLNYFLEDYLNIFSQHQELFFKALHSIENMSLEQIINILKIIYEKYQNQINVFFRYFLQSQKIEQFMMLHNQQDRQKYNSFINQQITLYIHKLDKDELINIFRDAMLQKKNYFQLFIFIIKFIQYLDTFNQNILQKKLSQIIEIIKEYKIWEKFEAQQHWILFANVLILVDEKDLTRILIRNNIPDFIIQKLATQN